MKLEGLLLRLTWKGALPQLQGIQPGYLDLSPQLS